MGLNSLTDYIGYKFYGWILRNVNPLCPIIHDWVVKYAVYQHRFSRRSSL